MSQLLKLFLEILIFDPQIFHDVILDTAKRESKKLAIYCYVFKWTTYSFDQACLKHLNILLGSLILGHQTRNVLTVLSLMLEGRRYMLTLFALTAEHPRNGQALVLLLHLVEEEFDLRGRRLDNLFKIVVL